MKQLAYFEVSYNKTRHQEGDPGTTGRSVLNSHLLGPKVDLSRSGSYFEHAFREKVGARGEQQDLGKPGKLMKGLRALHMEVKGRMDRAQLHKISKDLGKHLKGREIAMQQYYANIPLKLSMKWKERKQAAKSDNPLFSQEAKVKISRMHGSLNKPVIPWVSEDVVMR